MPFINFTNVATMFLALALFVLTLFLGKETHKSGIPAIMLFVFLIIFTLKNNMSIICKLTIIK